jgi:opacity protein-like surface antigen
MKKILIAILPIIVSSSNAFAIEDKTNFYFKTNIGVSSFKDASLGGAQMDFFRTSMKKNIAPNFGLGFGYKIRENLRSDITLLHFTNLRINSKNPDRKTKSCMNIVSMSLYLDLYKFNNGAKIFLGLGAGVANINTRTIIEDKSSSSKTINPYAKIELGGSMPINDYINFDLSYSWNEFGKNKGFTTDKGTLVKKTPYKAHNISSGLRFDI